jgi:hypothetical protein
MKLPFLLVLALSLTLSGCALFRTSPTWETVVSARSNYSGSGGAKDDYIDHLHQVLSTAGIEHKVVTFQFHFHNAYREEGVDTSAVVLYRDDATPRDPWWAMDDYHHVPVWLPSWEVKRQVGFFVQREVEIISVKEYRGAVGEPDRKSSQPLARRTEEQKLRSLFVNNSKNVKMRAERPAKPVKVAVQPKTIAFRKKVVMRPQPAANQPQRGKTAANDRVDNLFRSVHGTVFDPGSTADRQKMAALRKQFLNRNQSSRLRRD